MNVVRFETLPGRRFELTQGRAKGKCQGCAFHCDTNNNMTLEQRLNGCEEDGYFSQGGCGVHTIYKEVGFDPSHRE